MKKAISCFFLLAFALRAFSFEITVDSVGVKNINGNNFILHKVRSGETLYSLKKRYNCTYDEIIKANPELEHAKRILVNQVLKFPTSYSLVSSEPKKYGTSAEKKLVVHRVSKGETLYGISRDYNISVSEIKRLNNLTSSSIKYGQKLIVGKQVVVAEPKATEIEESIKRKPAPIFKKILPSVAEENPVVVPNAPRGIQHEEIGIAEIISTNHKSNKHLALHRTAPVGTLIMVRNKANNSQVMVKVIGELPETGENNDVLIRISPSAYYKLYPKDKRLRAEISYALPYSTR